MAITLLLKENDIPELTSFDGNIDADRLKPFINIAQTNDVKRILGKALYDKIYADYVADNLAGEYLTIYNDYVVGMLVYFSCAKYMTFGNAKVSNKGSHKINFENATPLDVKEVAKLKSAYEQLAINVEQMFYDYMETVTVTEYNDKDAGAEETKIIPWY